ncbi:hypothetical protein HanXRQr2_Chr13g0615641 [Helianthus annuus]|uniref:Uncharacterized protein n=1 Tax=Helianthus annuus TaxID=4232 RepID=A0A9K3ELY9_HELAN|nr:hypothetical protein HanXRQr2_Chr13g0615641 [Helianthus annuus]
MNPTFLNGSNKVCFSCLLESNRCIASVLKTLAISQTECLDQKLSALFWYFMTCRNMTVEGPTQAQSKSNNPAQVVIKYK